MTSPNEAPSIFQPMIFYTFVCFIKQLRVQRMNLREALLREHSKANTVSLTNEIGTDQQAFDELIALFLGNEYRVTQRAAWVVAHCIEAHPWLVKKHLKSMIENLQNTVHDAVKRNTIRILQFVEIPEDLLGITAEICFSFLNSAKSPIAIKAHAMSVLFEIVKKYPDLKEELKVSIEEQMPFGSAGIVSRGKRILTALEKI